MGEASSAFPLAWPAGKPRTPNSKRRKGAFSGTPSEMMWRLSRQVELLGGRYLLISSDLPLRADGKPHLGRAAPWDPGVCAYFEMGGQPYAMACDTFNTPFQNVAALANHIDATRRIERYGVASASETLRAFQALPAPKQPHEILGVDKGGSQAAASEINAARDAMLRRAS